jgi:hypothetical protein
LCAMSIRDKPIAPASPWQNGFTENCDPRDTICYVGIDFTEVLTTANVVGLAEPSSMRPRRLDNRIN